MEPKKKKKKKKKRTLEELIRKIHTHIRIPARAWPRIHRLRNRMRLNLLHMHENPIPCAKADNNLRDPKKEGLDPEFHELAMEIIDVAGGADFLGRLELDPVDGFAGGWFDVPYYWKGRNQLA